MNTYWNLLQQKLQLSQICIMNRPYQAPSHLLAIFFPPLPSPDIALGTLHLVFPPLLQLNRWFEQIVMVLHLTACENFPTRHKIRSSSSTRPENLWADKWVSILLAQETNGMISLELFLPWPQGPLARVLKEQYAFMIYTTLLVNKVFLTIN